MSSAARIAATAGLPTTPAVTVIAPSARARRRRTGSLPAKPTCCRSATSTWSSRSGRDRPDCLPEQGGGLRPAVPHGSRDADHRRHRSQAPRCPHRRHRRAPQLGLGDDPPPARSHDRAGRRDIARRHALAALPARLPVSGSGAVPPVPPALSSRTCRRTCGRPAGVLWRSQWPARSDGLRRPPRAATEEELVRLRQAALRRGPRRCSPISPATPTVSPSRTAG